MNKEQAYDIASNWGSYMRAGDPGACFYGFHFMDGRPVTEAHRLDCLRYTATLLEATGSPANMRELKRLQHWFDTAPLRDDPETEAEEFSAAFPGYQVRHDVSGFYICTDEEGEHEDDGHASVGFDGRPHWPSIAEAIQAFRNA